MWFLRLGRSFSCFRVPIIGGGGDEVGPFSRGKMGVFLKRIKLSNSSRTPLSFSLPNNSRKKETTFLQKALLCCTWGKQFSLNPVYDISLSLFGIPSRKRGLLETQRTFFDFPWVNKIKQSSSFFQHSFLHWFFSSLKMNFKGHFPSVSY